MGARGHRLIGPLLGVAVVIRLAVLLVFPSVFAFEQTGAVHGSEAYDTYAQNLLATGVYGITPGAPDALIPPLYSYVLAALYAVFGRGYFTVGLFHILLDALSIAMLCEIGRRLMPRGEAVGLLAGSFYALYPYLIFQNLTLIDTPLFMALLYAFILAMVLLRERPAFDRAAWLLAGLGGLALGLSMLVRPVVPPLALLAALWFLFRLDLKQTVARLLPVALVGVAAVMPWVLRNYTVYDAFVPMTTTSGANFWQGNSPYTVPYLRAGYDVQWTAPELEAVNPDSREADAERFALATAYLRDNPGKIPELLWVKFLVHWSIDIAPRYNPTSGEAPQLEEDYTGAPLVQGAGGDGGLSLSGVPEGDPVNAYAEPLFEQVGRTVHRFYYGGLFCLALFGAALSARRWREVSLLGFVQLAMTAVYVFFHPSTRYRVPTDPLLFLFSAYALVWLWARVRERERKKSKIFTTETQRTQRRE
ncbi:MAG: glycosyltransferase family 39 protein [Anaerolineae bacterium]|nr:glycosyltransferase family 39 protein [Anaerolineae bacterium]